MFLLDFRPIIGELDHGVLALRGELGRNQSQIPLSGQTGREGEGRQSFGGRYRNPTKARSDSLIGLKFGWGILLCFLEKGGEEEGIILIPLSPHTYPNHFPSLYLDVNFYPSLSIPHLLSSPLPDFPIPLISSHSCPFHLLLFSCQIFFSFLFFPLPSP